MAAKRILVVDPRTAGISGDMMVAALLGAGADPAAVVSAMKAPVGVLAGCAVVDVVVSDVERRGIRATRVDVIVGEEYTHRAPQDLVDAAAICLQGLRISDSAGLFALRAIDALVSAEATVHGCPPDELELHETGSADTVADVIGSAVALDDLGAFEDAAIYATPVATGGGVVHFSHGAIASPAPATLEILRSHQLPMVGGPVEAELATPTGAALLAALAPNPTTAFPPMTPDKVGYGAGTRDFPEMPNVLRLAFGQPTHSGLVSDEVWIIEANLDDATGETIGYAIQQILKAGARDVVAIPMSTKKARPGHILQIIADSSTVDRLSSVVIAQTGSLGVRVRPCERRVLLREHVTIQVAIGDVTHEIRVKVARDTDGRIVRAKPEYDDLAAVADLVDRPLREIDDMARRKAADVLGTGGTT